VTTTAQDLYRYLMRDLVGPGLREIGFIRSYARGFQVASGEYAGFFQTQKSVGSTRTEVWFSVHLLASHVPSRAVYWAKELQWLVPEIPNSGWTVEVGSPPEPVAESVLNGFRRYGWPAMRAAMDAPGFPPDPWANWARTFPRLDVTDLGYGPADLGEIAWVLRPTGEPADQWFAMLGGESARGRIDGLRLIAEEAADDPRRRIALFDRRERDPSRRVRKYASDLLAFGFDENNGGPPNLDQIAAMLQSTGRSADKWFAKLDTQEVAGRQDALRMMDEEARDDPRMLPVLLDRLERDPSPWVREDAASLLASRARDRTIMQALRDAAEQDEDSRVRWAAKYAIRLAMSEQT
jgi:hypothetical protein